MCLRVYHRHEYTGKESRIFCVLVFPQPCEMLEGKDS
jgi:hypothetical protein